MRDAQDCRYGERLERRGCVRLHDRVQITDVARDVHRRDLSCTIAALAEAANDARYYERHVVGDVSERNEVAVGSHLLSVSRQVQDCLLFLLGKDRTASQPVEI
jgi:hypothetical protein